MNYILIPEEVYSDDTLPPNAKILYGHILKIHRIRNGCYAQNEYFVVKLYQKKHGPPLTEEEIKKHIRQVQRYIANLKKNKCVYVYLKRDSSKKIASRKIVPLYQNVIKRRIDEVKEAKDAV